MLGGLLMLALALDPKHQTAVQELQLRLVKRKEQRFAQAGLPWALRTWNPRRQSPSTHAPNSSSPTFPLCQPRMVGARSEIISDGGFSELASQSSSPAWLGFHAGEECYW